MIGVDTSGGRRVMDNESRQLAEMRRDAWVRYRELSYPEGREELWRFTDVKAIHPDNFALLAPDSTSEITTTPEPAEAGRPARSAAG